MKHIWKMILACFVLLMPCARLWAADTWEMIVVDTEGGKSIVMLTPDGESMLVDAGFPGNGDRDTKRIVAAAEELKIKQFDYILATHYDLDHVANIANVDAKIPAKVFLDRGPLEPGTTQREIPSNMTSYLKCIGARKRVTLKAGDVLPLKGMKVTVLTASGEVIKTPLPGAGKPNPFASSPKPEVGPQDENAKCIGLLYEFGKFRMADFADLLQTQEFALMAPDNPVGTVDLLMVSHHGAYRSSNPVLVHALHPKVAIMNNGARKGGDPITLDTLKASPGLQDMWQLHTSNAAKEKNVPADFIANTAVPCEGKAIRVSVRRDGTFTVTNTRNNFAKTYQIMEATSAARASMPSAGAAEKPYVPPFDAAAAGMTSLFDGKTLGGWAGDPECWKVVGGVIVGVKGNQNLMTVGDYDDFRLILSTRQVKEPTNHQGVGFWGEHMPVGKYGYGGCVDVMPPMNWTWDYTVNKAAPGKLSISRNLDKELGFKRSEWTQAEILTNRAKGTIRMAVNGVEMLYYTDNNPGRLKKGPIGLQAHAGNQDVRYKDIYIEVAPREDKLITLKK